MDAVSRLLPGRAALAGPLLAAATLLLVLANLWELGGPELLVAAMREPAAASMQGLQLLYGWLPRIAACLIAGAGLGAAGTVMQQVLRNPIASPSTLGVAAGAKLALSVATLLAPAAMAGLAEPVAMAGGALALALVLGLSWRRDLEPVTVVLAGLMVTLSSGAIHAGLLLFFEYDLTALLIWGSGALMQHDWSGVAFLAPRVSLGFAALLMLARPLTVMTLDDASVRGLGLRLQHARILCLGVAVYLTACIVSALGVIGFVGLAAPALARLLGARTLRQRLLWAPLVGGGLLLLTDQLVQRLDGHFAGLLPTGAFTALLGAPLLLWLLREVRSAAPAVPSPGGDWSVSAGNGRLVVIWVGAAITVLLAMGVYRDAAGWHLQLSAAGLEAAPWRPPRVAAAAVAGLLLALAGALLQRLLRNPMASPEVLGISGGALGGIIVAVLIAPAAPYSVLLGAATLGAFATGGGMMFFASRTGYAPERLLLAGIAVKELYDGVTGLVAASGTPFWMRLLSWMTGSTYGTEWPVVGGAALALAASLPAALLLHRWLGLLALGEDQALAQGLHVPRARMVLLLLAAVATAAATLLVGPLSFVGLMAPHLAGLLGLRRARAHLVGSCGVGVTLMVAADWAGRTVLMPYELPAGIVASAIGGLYFMWLLYRR